MIRERLQTIRNGIRRLKRRTGDSKEGSNSDADPNEGSGGSGGASEPASALFECPECGTVYVDAHKDRCRTCRTDVTEVRSTLTTE